MDGYDKIMHNAGKFVFPAIFTITGLVMLIMGLSTDETTQVQQTSEFVFGGLALLLMGILMIFNVMGVFKRKSKFILIPALIGVCIWYAFMNYESIKERLDLEEEYMAYNTSVKQALLDIRDVEVAFRKTYQRYSSSKQELESFLTTGTVPYITSLCDERAIPDDRMSLVQADSLGIDPNTDEGNRAMERIDEDEAVKLGLITRDTIEIPAMDFIFNGYHICKCEEWDVNVSPMSNIDKRKFSFEIGSLWSKRLKEGEFEVYSANIGDSAQAKHVFKVFDPKPFDPFLRRDTLIVGDLTKHHTEGNWRD